MTKEIVCTVCPRGCTVTVEGENGVVQSATGFSCKRGQTFAESEFSHPVRILTTLVKVRGEEDLLVPVRTDRPVGRDQLFACMEAIRAVEAPRPIRRYDVLIRDVCGTGANVVATKDIP